jgi:hypothetical protein
VAIAAPFIDALLSFDRFPFLDLYSDSGELAEWGVLV